MRLPDGRIRKCRRSEELQGCAHELTFSCYARLALLSRDRTRRWLTDALDRARVALGFELWAYVNMPDHVHVLVHPTEPGYRIAGLLQAIRQRVARRALAYLRESAPSWLARLTDGQGDRAHFWQPGGGYDRMVGEIATAQRIVRYTHENPVKRGLVRRAEEWPWSSARWYAGLDDVVLAMDPNPDLAG